MKKRRLSKEGEDDELTQGDHAEEEEREDDAKRKKSQKSNKRKQHQHHSKISDTVESGVIRYVKLVRFSIQFHNNFLLRIISCATHASSLIFVHV